MLRLYYSIWADLIHRARSRPENRRNWKWVGFAMMTMAMGLNLVLVMVCIQELIDSWFYDIEFPELPKYWDNVLAFFILFLLPPLMVNYLLIFRNRRYEWLVQKYPCRSGKWFLVYFLISLFLPLLLLWTGMAWSHIGNG